MPRRKPLTKRDLEIREWAAEIAKNICENDICYDQWATPTPKLVRIYITEFLTEKLSAPDLDKS